MRGDPLNPLWGKRKIKEKKMNYLVLNFKKIKSKEEFKNVIAGHNFRTREYKNRENIDTTRTKDNIILSPLKFKMKMNY